MIELQQVSFAYPSRHPLFQDFNLSFPEGKITTILGSNGSGKSTLLKLAARLLTPQQGQVLLDGKDVHTMKSKEVAKRISLLHQKNFPPEITVATLVSYGRYPYHKYGQSFTQQDHDAVEKALSQVQLHDLRNSLLTRLSGGQRQRAFIAMALAQDTDIVFLDEPTTYLDINIRLELMELVRFLNGQGKTIIMVLHDLNLALENSHNIVLLERGKLYAEGSPDQVIETGLLDKIFNIQTPVFHKDGKTFHHFSRQKS